jgi:hypothetical protein
MVDVRDTDLDLSVLARVAPPPDQDEKPQTQRNSAGSGEAPRADEPPPDTTAKGTRRRVPRGRVKSPPDPDTQSRSRTFVPDDDVLLPDYTPGMFVKPLIDAYMTIGAVVLPLNEPIGTSIMQNAEPCARSIDNAAKLDKKFRAYLLRAMGAGVILPILIAHMPIAMVIVVTLFPGRPPAEVVQLPDQEPGETVNPVSNGFRRQR